MRSYLCIFAVVSLASFPSESPAQCYDYAAPGLELLSVFSGNDSFRDVAVSGDFAFLAVEENNSTAKLRVVDLSDPMNPFEAGDVEFLGLGATTVESMGDHVFVGDEITGVHVFDVSDPTDPVRVRVLGFGSNVATYDITVSGNYAYVVIPDGLRILDVSTPSQAQLVGSSSFGSQDGRVVVAGNYAYVTGGSGLVVVDVTNPTVPSIVSTLEISLGQDAGLAISGSLVCVAGSNGTLYVVDVSAPVSPIIVDTIDVLAGCRDVAIDGSLVFVTGHLNFLRVIDLSLPNPEVVAVGPAHGHRLVLDGGRAFVTFAADLNIVDITPPRSAPIVGHLATESYTLQVDVSDDLLFIADNREGFQIADVSDRTTPVILGHLDTPGNAEAVAASGSYAYVVAGGLQVIDVSSPKSPVIVGSAGVSHVEAIDVADNLACVGNIWRLELFDVSDPTEPIALDPVPTGSAYGVDILADYAYVASPANGLVVVDISVPSASAIVSTVPMTAYDVQVTTGPGFLDLAVVATTFGCSIVDISDPSAPLLMSQLQLSGIPWGVDVEDEVAYVSTFHGGMSVIDISNPGAPQLLGTGWPLFDRAVDVVVSEDHVFVAAYDAGTVIFPKQCGDPTGAGVPVSDLRSRVIVPVPNPSHGPSTLLFDLPRSSHVRLEVFDASGRSIRQLTPGNLMAGTQSVFWDGHNSNGVRVGSGVYLTRVEWMGGSITGRIDIVR